MFNRVVSMCLLFSKEIFAATYYAKNRKFIFLKLDNKKHLMKNLYRTKMIKLHISGNKEFVKPLK